MTTINVFHFQYFFHIFCTFFGFNHGQYKGSGVGGLHNFR